MKKIDLHLHLTPFQLPKLGKMNLTSGKNMLPHLEELGIEKGVLMSSAEGGLPFGTNKSNRKICEKFPDRYAWMCAVDPKGKEPVYDRLARFKRQGAIGIGELTTNRRLDDPFLQELFAAAEKLRMPVTIHMSPEEGYSYGVVDDPGLPLLEEVLKKYPGLKILGHSQTFWIEMSADAPKEKEVRNQWGDGPVIPGGRVPELFAKYPNLYGDLSANSGGKTGIQRLAQILLIGDQALQHAHAGNQVAQGLDLHAGGSVNGGEKVCGVREADCFVCAVLGDGIVDSAFGQAGNGIGAAINQVS